MSLFYTNEIFNSFIFAGELKNDSFTVEYEWGDVVAQILNWQENVYASSFIALNKIKYKTHFVQTLSTYVQQFAKILGYITTK